MKLDINLERKDLFVLLVISAYIFLFFKPVITADGYGHYVILEGVVRDHTLNFTEQKRFNEAIGLEYVRYNRATQKYVSPYSFGLAMLSAPLYSVSLFLDNFDVFHIKDDFFIKERGDILIHQASVAMTSLIFIYLALILSIVITKKYVSKKYAAISVLVIFFSSPLLRYATYDISWTHGVEVGLMSAAVLLILKNSNPLYIGALIGLLTTVRYTSFVFLVIIGTYLLYYKKYGDSMKLAAGALPFFLALMIYSNLQFGGSFSTGYSEVLKVSPIHPSSTIHILDILFNFDRGMIVWTPNLLIALYGLFLMKDNKKWIFLGFFGSYLVGYSMFRSWHGGWSFGNRYFTVLFPIFCVGIASFLKNLPRLKPVVCSLAVYTGFLSLLFLAHSEDPNVTSFLNNINFWFLEGNIVDLPELLVRKVGLYRLFFGL